MLEEDILPESMKDAITSEITETGPLNAKGPSA